MNPISDTNYESREQCISALSHLIPSAEFEEHPDHSFFFERETERGGTEGRRERERERISQEVSQEVSMLIVEPSVGFCLMTLRSRPELKSRVKCLAN